MLGLFFEKKPSLFFEKPLNAQDLFRWKLTNELARITFNHFDHDLIQVLFDGKLNLRIDLIKRILEFRYRLFKILYL